MERVFFVAKKRGSRGRAPLFAVGEYGVRLPDGFVEVRHPPTRTLQMSNAIRRKKQLEAKWSRRGRGRR